MPRVSLNTPAPDFTLANFKGQPVRMSDFRSKAHIVLVFNRGFTWPFCQRHMAQLRQDYQEFVKRQAQVIVVGPEDARAFESYWSQHNLPFIGLPDPKASVLKQYGQEVNLFKLGRMPAQVIVDKAGMVRFVHYGHSMSDIPDNVEILELLDQLNLWCGGKNGYLEDSGIIAVLETAATELLALVKLLIVYDFTGPTANGIRSA
jgi:thioredoxin-dependent peroxiredoxin